MEVRGRSSVEFDDQMKVLDILNDSPSPLVQLATSIANFKDTTFTNLKSSRYNLLIDMVQTNAIFDSCTITDFDKTLVQLEDGNLKLLNSNFLNGILTKYNQGTEEEHFPFVKSMGFIVLDSDMEIAGTTISNIQT